MVMAVIATILEEEDGEELTLEDHQPAGAGVEILCLARTPEPFLWNIRQTRGQRLCLETPCELTPAGWGQTLGSGSAH